MNPRLTAEAQAFIQRQLDAMQPDDSLGDWVRRRCKAELRAWPIDSNLVYLWALRPDGTLLCMDHEALGGPTEEEQDPRRAAVVLTRAARSHPELRCLVPDRPPAARTCPRCGALPTEAECARCDGVGWL